VEGALALAELLATATGETPLVPVAGNDLAVLQYTGGTTGTPKGAMLTHANIFANVVQSETWYHRSYQRGEDRYLLVIPYFHIYAFTVGMMCGTWIGAQQIMLPKYDVEQVLAAMRDYRPTYFPAVPTVFVSLLSHPRVKEYGLERVRRFNSGGAPCPIAVMEEFEQRIGRPLNQGYGLSETSPVTHAQPLLGPRRLGTIGLPVPSTDIKVVDVETGTRDLPFGQEGELCISGPQVMKGYWNNPEETAQVLRVHADGRTWFHTGDIARIDADGFTTIVQRKKDLIIVDGFNVYPSDVERVLHTHAAVKLAAVIGLPDPYHGEIVKAFVVLRDGMAASAEQLAALCRASLAEFKRPAQFEFRDSLPVSAVGKVLYRVLRDEVRVSETR
jgi:long-chain acyl-CoA synthetase